MRIENPDPNKWYEVPGYDGRFKTNTKGQLLKVKDKESRLMTLGMNNQYQFEIRGKRKVLSPAKLLYITFVGGEVPQGYYVTYRGKRPTIHNLEVIRIGANIDHNIPIAKLDENGEVVKVYSSIALAAKDNFYSPTCLKYNMEKRKSAFATDGFAYVKNTEKDIEEKRRQIRKEIKSMTGNKYQTLAMRTCNIPYDDREGMLRHAVFGLTSEAGEVAGILQKVYQGHEFSREHMKKELGDCLWMIAEACEALDFTMDEVMEINIEKLKARFPEGFSAERSLHRAEGDV